MDNNDLCQLGAKFRPELSMVSEDHQWSAITSKLAEMTRSTSKRIKNIDYPRNVEQRENAEFQEDDGYENLRQGLMNMDLKMNVATTKSSFTNPSVHNLRSMYQKSDAKNATNFKMNAGINGANSNSVINGSRKNNRNSCFETLRSTETLARNEILGGYIFIFNNDTKKVDLLSRLFCLPPRYRDSVREITPGLPLFLYNYTTSRLHGIFETATFGGSNIDPTAWEDINCKDKSMFPAQVRIRLRKFCRSLEEDSFRPILHHCYGPRFRFEELSVAETVALLDLYEKQD